MKLVILLAAAIGGLYAQTISGSIVGTVLDSSGNSIPNAAVKLQSERTGEERSATANDAGDFLFPVLLLVASMFFTSLYFTFRDSFEPPPEAAP